MPSQRLRKSGTFKNLEMLKVPMLAYGGDLRKKAKNRGHRPLVFRSGTMHICFRSTQAVGKHSFLAGDRQKKIKNFVMYFSKEKGIQILSFANVGNHLHLHVKLSSLTLYRAWVRGLTSGIAMIAMGLEGLKTLKLAKKKFWDQRPFSRVIKSFQHFLNTRAYLEINALEGLGMPRREAELVVSHARRFIKKPAPA